MGETIARSRVVAGSLSDGALFKPLPANRDDRGAFTEIYRAGWSSGPAAVQWNFVRSAGNVLRGVRVHFRHDDFLVLLEGRASIGLRDLRRDSPTEGAVALVELWGVDLALLKTPAGVAHGIYSHTPAVFAVGITAFHEDSDENPCRWNDPGLGIPWPFAAPVLSERDAAAGSLAELLPKVPAWRRTPA